MCPKDHGYRYTIQDMFQGHEGFFAKLADASVLLAALQLDTIVEESLIKLLLAWEQQSYY